MSHRRDLTDDLAKGAPVLALLARGWTSKHAAGHLGLSESTVDRRLKRLYAALGARNAAHAVAIAGLQRLLTPEDLRAAAADRRDGWRPGQGKEA